MEDDIRTGMVTVNGVVVRNPAVRVTSGDVVRFDGARVAVPAVFLAAMNKPVGVETTMDTDAPRGVHTLSRGMPPGTTPVGRLDVRTGGLLLWSNDGDLNYRLTHPKWALEREYILLFHEPPDPRAMDRLRKGAFIARGQFSRPLTVGPGRGGRTAEAGHRNRQEPGSQKALFRLRRQPYGAGAGKVRPGFPEGHPPGDLAPPDPGRDRRTLPVGWP